MVKHYKITERGQRHILRENRQEKKINKSLVSDCKIYRVAIDTLEERCYRLVESFNFPYEKYYSLHSEYTQLCDKYCSLSKDYADVVSSLNVPEEISDVVENTID